MLIAPRRPLRHSQSGVAMIVVLMFLLAVLGIALYSARYATLGEGIARNQLDYEVARQSAEAALRDAERDLLINEDNAPKTARCTRALALSLPARFDPDCTQGLCKLEPADYKNAVWNSKSGPAEPWWPADQRGKWSNDVSKPAKAGDSCTFVGGVPLGTFTGAPALGGVAQQPEYMVEVFTRGKKDLYRITARGFGYSGDTQAVLQTYFQPPSDDAGS